MNEAQEAFLGEVRRLLGPPVYIKPEEVPFVEISDPDRLCQSPLVSVVCITYNHSKYIEKTFRGFMEQVTSFPFEIIVGEDCSTDDTLEQCKVFQNQHPDKVRLLTWSSNVGSTANFLRCLMQCRGKYVAFCEGDDFWCCSSKLQKQADYLESHSECGFVHANANVISDDYKKDFSTWHSKLNEQFFFQWDNANQDLLDRKVQIATGTVMIRRSVLFSLLSRYPEVYTRVRALGDLQLWSGALSESRQHYMADVVSSYTLSNNSATRCADPRKRLKFIVDVLEARLEINELFVDANDANRLHLLDWHSSAMLYSAYQIMDRKLLDSIVNLRTSEGFINDTSTRILIYSYRRNFNFVFAHTMLRLRSLWSRAIKDIFIT